MRTALVAALALASVLGAGAARAQIQDHLACVKIKDTIPKASYTIGLQDFAYTGTAWPGCIVKTPAKRYCQVQSRASITPPNPGDDGPGQLLNNDLVPIQGFFCYSIKCPKRIMTIASTGDEFGTRTIPPFVTAPKEYCVPSAPGSPSGAFLDAAGSS